LSHAKGWPARISSGIDPVVTLRPLRMSDVSAWRSARQRNTAWLVRWDATVPPGADPRATTFRALVRRLRAAARRGTTYPFAVEVDGRFAGQLTINNIVRGSAQFASVGYWLDRDFAGRGVMPRAVAMAIDGTVVAIDGETIRIDPVSICVHGDTPGAVDLATRIRAALTAAGATVAAFTR